jgi:phage shock protein PspC (stress-responsive transcriptional regulator)
VRLREIATTLGVTERSAFGIVTGLTAVITGGAGVLAYLVAWVIIPGEGQKSSTAENITGKKQDAWSG